MKSKEKRSGDVGCCEVDNSGLATVFPTMINHFYLKYDIAGLSVSGLSWKSIVSLQAVRSAKTLAAYEADWNDFCGWCNYHKQDSFPATSDTIVNYINDLADYAKASTIKRRISAISENYKVAVGLGFTRNNPCDAWIVKETLLGISRSKQSTSRPKTPIAWDELQLMISIMDLASLTGLRDRALLLLGFTGAFRRSELAALLVENIHRHPQGVIIDIPFSNGKQIFIPDRSETQNNPKMDCVQSMRAWIRAGQFRNGPFFRRLSKSENVLPYGLTDKSISNIIKKYVATIGLDPTNYGGQSLRNGFRMSALELGLTEEEIRRFMKR